jgi:ADP-ribosylglycohydrolase
MAISGSLGGLFQDGPTRWGLRGDPHLWREMGAALAAAPLPGTDAELVALLERTFERLAGAPLSGNTPFFVEKYAHGGMSSGYVSREFWRETALPLLRSRFALARLDRLAPTDLPRWPSAAGIVDRDLARDLFRGCLLWGAVGDALGRPAEGRTPEDLRARYGPGGLREYVPWHGWTGGPRGTFTDDTQLSMAVAESLVATGGVLDPPDLVRRFLAIPHIRGMGRATRAALAALRAGDPWWVAGVAVHSAGNGAAMRAAPVGLAHALDGTPAALVRDAVRSAVPTHAHPVGVAGAAALAAGVAWCVRARLAGAERLDGPGFVAFVAGAIDGLEPGPTPERKPGGRAIRLVDRLRELPDLLTWPDPAAVFAHTHNGAFALESVPAALYCFLRSPNDPRSVILAAVNAGYDADSVASMAGNLAGAWRGAAALEASAPSWWADLEAREDLAALADRLADLALAAV